MSGKNRASATGAKSLANMRYYVITVLPSKNKKLKIMYIHDKEINIDLLFFHQLGLEFLSIQCCNI